MAAPPPKKSKIYCNHCEKNVSRSTWYRHYSQFYDSLTGQWRSENERQYADSDFKFSSSDESRDDDHDDASVPEDFFSDCEMVSTV